MQKRLLEIAKHVNLDDKVADIGCDHGYLSIYLAKNNLCKKIIASDISINALSYAINNINKENLSFKIKTIVSDGLINIDDDIDTAVIAGMGASTILEIVSKSPIDIKKYIISSNNDHEKLRRSMFDLGYYIDSENAVFDNNKYYPIIVFSKSERTMDEDTFIIGLYNKSNSEYYKYLLDKYTLLLDKIPEDSDKEKMIKNKINILNNYLK